MSKADVLSPAEGESACHYVADQIRSELGLHLPVHAVSVKSGYTELFDRWLEAEIVPLYGRHAELARQSLNRKIGALRWGVEAALKTRLRRAGAGYATPIEIEPAKLRDLEIVLRTASGKISEARTKCVNMSDAFRECGGEIVRIAAASLIDEAAAGRNRASVKSKLERTAAEGVSQIVTAIEEAVRAAENALGRTAEGLRREDRPQGNELIGVMSNLPRFDLGSLEISLSSPGSALWGRRWAVRRIRKRIEEQAGTQIDEAVRVYARVMEAWVRKTFTELQERFDSYADAYRAQLERLDRAPPRKEPCHARSTCAARSGRPESWRRRFHPGPWAPERFPWNSTGVP